MTSSIQTGQSADGVSALQREYEAVRNGAGLIDLSANGRVRVSGSEAVMFLNGLITNDMKMLAENRWMQAIFPTVQGRLIAATRVTRLADEQTPKGSSPVFLLETEATTRQILLKTIERFTVAGDFRVSDLTDSTSMLSLQGPQAATLMRRVFGDQIPDLDQDAGLETDWQGRTLIVIRATHTGEDGFDLIVDKEHGPSLEKVLLEAGAVLVGEQAQEVLRIEAGIPRYGRDMDETNVIPELNMEDAISYTKGCYIGQEIIIRIKHRGHAAKKLVGLTINDGATIAAGATIKALDGADIGRLTSAVFSPRLKNTIGLGYVRYEHSAANTEVRVVSEGIEMPARVTALPFGVR